MEEIEDEKVQCQEPCNPALNQPCCIDYWERMRVEGYWDDNKGWTDKGWREICK